ncbi:MAG TPA: hypothetical protein ENK82_03915 [Campylobacterales bacterium]|nr:hypothetical protein [Campylobacterales bacterium]
MRQIISYIFLCSILLNAENITLNELLAQSVQIEQLENIIDKKGEAMKSKTLANTATSPLNYQQNLLRSQSKLESGYEHQLGFSKEIKLGNVQSLEREQSALNNEAILIDNQQSIVTLSNQIKNRYHDYCLEKTYLSSYRERVERFGVLYAKKERAFQEGEISKTELVQIALEKEKLEGQLNQLRETLSHSKKYLLSLGDFSQNSTFSCDDLSLIEKPNVSDNDALALTAQAYEKRMESVQKGLQRYGKTFDTVELSAGYLKELNRDVYNIGISIPLNFSSKKYEYERASLMQHASAIALEKEQLLGAKLREIDYLKAKLLQNYHAILLEQKLIHSHNNRLLPMINKSYRYGESTVVEYLLAQQSINHLEEKLLEEKKAYYRSFFNLLTLQEKQ